MRSWYTFEIGLYLTREQFERIWALEWPEPCVKALELVIPSSGESIALDTKSLRVEGIAWTEAPQNRS